MCFSPAASFSLSAVLAVIGFAAIKQTKSPQYRLIAWVPILFAIQQLAEGFVWLYLKGTLPNPAISLTAQYIFLFFAWILWPTYTPLALLISETVLWKKIVCVICLALGVIVSYIGVHYLTTTPLATTIVGNSVDYGLSQPYENIVYSIPLFVPIFISSVKNLWIFGFFLLISFIISQLIYALTFTSVWCFFAGAISIILYFVLSSSFTKNNTSDKIST